MITMIIISIINEAMIKFYQKLGLITTFVKTEGPFCDQMTYTNYAITLFIIYLAISAIIIFVIPYIKEEIRYKRRLKKERTNAQCR